LSIKCWPYGHNTRNGDCCEVLPDDSSETMRRFGWGFVCARDDGSDSGEGYFLACPEHRDDCDGDALEHARQANRLAKAMFPPRLSKAQRRCLRAALDGHVNSAAYRPRGERVAGAFDRRTLRILTDEGFLQHVDIDTRQITDAGRAAITAATHPAQAPVEEE
jgi:hypothetical protein